MLCATHDFEVGRIVIQTISVLMVNHLASSQCASQEPRHDRTVLEFALHRGDPIGCFASPRPPNTTSPALPHPPSGAERLAVSVEPLAGGVSHNATLPRASDGRKWVSRPVRPLPCRSIAEAVASRPFAHGRKAQGVDVHEASGAEPAFCHRTVDEEVASLLACYGEARRLGIPDPVMDRVNRDMAAFRELPHRQQHLVERITSRGLRRADAYVARPQPPDCPPPVRERYGCMEAA